MPHAPFPLPPSLFPHAPFPMPSVPFPLIMNPDDLKELIGAFIAETQDFIQSLEANLLAMEAKNTGNERLQLVKEMFRAAHSIKGAALMFGFEDLSKAAHSLEDCFAILRDKADLSQHSQETVSALLQGVDRLKKIAQQVATGQKGDARSDAEAIARVKAQLEAHYGKETPTPVAASNPAINPETVKVIFEVELVPVLARLETEISQVTPETLAETASTLNEIYYQLSGVAGMLQLPNFAKIADRLRGVIDDKELTLEKLQSQAWAIAIALQNAREAVLQGKPISLEEPATVAETVEFTPTADTPHSPSLPLPPSAPPVSSSTASVRPTIRVDLERLTELVNLVGELVINRTNMELQETQLRAEVKRIRRKILDLNQFGSQLREEYDRLAGESWKGGEKHKPETTRAKEEETEISATPNRSLLNSFDSLEMDRYTEFHATAAEVIETTQAIAQSAGKIDDLASKFERSTDRLRRLTDQLRSRVMQLRVVPFSRAVDHLPRAVRDLSQTRDKEVNLLLLGRDTKIDESLLEALRDPLVHLVRNAFDHGIEPPEVRKALGKPKSGQIEIEARHQGGQTIVTVSDDGKGIDPEAIRRQIVEKEYVSAEQARELSTAELYDFLFWPGFTTTKEVGDLSGRGVGLDVVRTNLRQVRGTVKVDSRPGKGTSFIIKLPLMLSISDALLARADRNTVAVPLDAVEEILHLEGQQIHKAGSQPMLRWRGEFIRLVRLQELLHYSIPHPDGPSPDPIAQDYIPVIVLGSSEGILAIAVERLVGQQEIVVKPLPAPLSKPRGIVGCTILGDGRVVLILDADDLVSQYHAGNKTQKSEIKTHKSEKLQTSELKLQPSPSQPQILVVDDSYTIRQLLGLTLNRARYRVVQAKDGQDALDKLQSGLDFSLVIADIEMPRMDGFELLQAIKSDAQLSRIPVAMLTSRSGAKHRKTALDLGAIHYFTKPYSEPQLLEVVAQLVKSV